jgi:hypothetical protein
MSNDNDYNYPELRQVFREEAWKLAQLLHEYTASFDEGSTDSTLRLNNRLRYYRIEARWIRHPGLVKLIGAGRPKTLTYKLANFAEKIAKRITVIALKRRQEDLARAAQHAEYEALERTWKDAFGPLLRVVDEDERLYLGSEAKDGDVFLSLRNLTYEEAKSVITMIHKPKEDTHGA